MKPENTKDELLQKRERADAASEAADDAAFLRAIEKKKNMRRTADDGRGTASDALLHADVTNKTDTESTENASPIASIGETVREKVAYVSDTERAHAHGRSKAQNAFRRFLTVLCVLLCMIVVGYTVFVFVPIPFVRKWRDIYIGTAMTTGDHQWLATYFIPSGIIDEVMNENTIDTDVIGGIEHLTRPVDTEEEHTGEPVGTESEPVETQPIEELDILGLKNLTVGGLDYAGNEVTLVDEEEGLFISKIDRGTYKGLVMLVDDPSRVFVGTTPEKTTRGYRIGEMMEYYGDVIAGVNASGFSDPNDSGDGSDIIGFCMSQGESWGNYVSYMASIVFTEDDKLVVGVFNDWESYGIRDGMQFGPVLVANGEINIKAGAAASFGLHPRTAIGQRADGAIVLLVIDGRDLTHSIGCTIEDMATIMMEYNAENAGCCDGGSSCVLAYDGEVLNKNSSANPKYGRRMPNAFLVRSKKVSES